QLFVALSEQKPHRGALVDLPGLARSASSYVVSATTASPPSPRAGGGDSSAEESAFRLLANLAFADGPRRRVLGLDGLVLASARALSASALVLAPPVPPAAPKETPLAAAVGAGEAAAALLGRLSPVLGAEGGEEELVAAGEALSAAVAAVSAAAAGRDVTAATATAVGLASEALHALLVLSWADSHSLDAAAAVDGFVTDSRFADSVVSLWRRGTASSPSGFGALSETALATMSSIAARPTGRQSLVAAGVASAVVDVALGQQGGGGDVAGDSSEGGCSQAMMMAQLSVSERGEIIRLLCVLCASPAHRGAVRSSLMVKRGVESGGDDDTEEATVEAAIVRVQGGRGGGEECGAGARRLALLLGVSPPSRRSYQNQGGTIAGAGAFAAEYLSSGDRRRAPSGSPPTGDAIKRRSTSATTRSPSPPPPPTYASARLEDDTASVDLEEALFPTVTATAVTHLGSLGAREASATPALSREAVAVAAVASPAPTAGRRDRARLAFPPPAAAPKNGRSDSEESLHRLLSMIANEDGSAAAAAAAANGSLRGEGDDKVACKSCGKLVFAPKGFDLALIECPHCQKPMG
ncbi:unnamed protein product, partial [Ectocarpus fasciculatus]